MNSAPSRSLINLLLESGVPSNEEAAQLAMNLNGGSWVGQVLDSGKVDEQRFLGAIGNFFRVPVVSMDAKKIDRATLSILPSRFVFQHHILPIEVNADDPEASVVKFVNQIIREAIFERATDIHVEPLENDLRIRYRIDGILHEVAVPPQLRVLQSAIISRLKVMSHMDIAERRLPQDGRMN